MKEKYGNLVVIIAKERLIKTIVECRLPRTFTTKTRNGDTHYYYIIPDFEKNIKLIGIRGRYYGDIKKKDQQVIGGLCVAEITDYHIQEFFDRFINGVN